MMKNQPKTKSTSPLTLSWRIGLPHWETDEAFGRLMGLFREHRPVVDEVALFETITHHLYIPLDDFAPRMEVAARRLDALRQAGIRSAGINVLCTIGHINEAWSYMPPLPFQAMVGHDGSVSTGCACPNTPEMRDYVRAKYRLVAAARPDFIWVDDDIRMHWHGILWGCFCPTCLGLFAQRAGRPYAREELVKAFDDPAAGHLREMWVEQNIASLESLLADVAAAIHEVDPEIVIGKMSCGPGGGTTYSGQAFERWYTALRATKARPGGSIYSDETPIWMYIHALGCGYQRASLPPAVTDLQYELENFPYQRLKKSATAMIDQCTLALAFGLNGVAFNMMALPGAYADFLPQMERIPAARPVWERWVAHAAGLPTAGLWPAWSSRLMARRSVRAGERWLGPQSWHDISLPRVLGEIGLPLAGDRSGCGVVLCGRVAEAFSDDELTGMLSGGVLMDSTALEVLSARGLGHLTGVRLAKRLDNGMMERFTADPLNGSSVGQLRDARIEFWGDATGMADVLEPVAGGVRTLATLEDYFYRPQGTCMTAFENELGGRVVVMGYAPWIFLHSVGKRLQLQNVTDWLSREAMPVRVDETVPLLSVARLSADRQRGAVLLLNAGLDEIREATVHLRVAARRGRLLTIGQPEREVELKPESSGGCLTVRDLPPWGFRLLLLG
ncbi:MAG: hypothetical protein WCI17_01040 [bacterium]